MSGHTDEKWSNSTCCGVVQEARHAAKEKQAQRTKGQPWIVLNLTIGITVAIIAYACYVYVGRLCVPMIERKPSALGTRTTGIAFLIVFCLILLMMLCAYIKIVLTHPGHAKQFVSKSQRPAPSHDPYIHDSWESSEIDDTTHELAPPRADLSRQVTGDVRIKTPSSSEQAVDGRAASRPPMPPERSTKSMNRSHPPLRANSVDSATRDLPFPSARIGPEDDGANAGIVDALPPVRAAAQQPQSSRGNTFRSVQNFNDLPPPLLSRRPATTPVLLPEYRYCPKCELVKPYRTHHCRACGTCVLKYDHHCPWIGQCVGARNHKYFVIFLEWAALFSLWTFATLLGLTVKARSNVDYNLDAQKIVIIALAGLFSLFTIMLLGSHVLLITRNQTTVESLSTQTMKERERATLGHMHPWYRFHAKALTKNHWDEEWGRIGAEGNLWWLGSDRANWEFFMGKSVWSWFLPLGSSPDDGLSYPTNPRFDEQGRWRRRKDWPPSLQ